MSAPKVDLEAIEARANAATPGEWVYQVRPNFRDTGSAHYDIEAPAFDGPCACGAKHPPGKLIAWLSGGLGDADIVARDGSRARHDASTEADAAFLAHSRQDVPALVAEVRRLREDLRAAIAKAESR